MTSSRDLKRLRWRLPRNPHPLAPTAKKQIPIWTMLRELLKKAEAFLIMLGYLTGEDNVEAGAKMRPSR